MTSHAVVEAEAAQDELFLILSEDPELRSLYKEAFHVMSIETFEKQLPRILKSYCTDLSKEASSDLERNNCSVHAIPIKTTHYHQAHLRSLWPRRYQGSTFCPA